MTELMYRFNIDPSKLNAHVVACLIFIWLLVLGCAVVSVMSQNFTKRQRWFWVLVIICFPGLGLLCYLPFSLSKDSLGKMYRGKAAK